MYSEFISMPSSYSSIAVVIALSEATENSVTVGLNIYSFSSQSQQP